MKIMRTVQCTGSVV